jgi:hypothetical protein
MARVFSREEFYELVWTKPLTALAKEFAISDVALHKICAKHDIPHPPLGWWAKKTAGRTVMAIPLPPPKADARLQIVIAGSDLSKETDELRDARENARLALATVGNAASKPDPLVAATVRALRGDKPDERGVVHAFGPRLVPTSVSPENIARAEHILIGVAHAASILGIFLKPSSDAAEFVCNGQSLPFTLTEQVRRVKHVLTPTEIEEDRADHRKRQLHPERWEEHFFQRMARPSRPQWDYYPTGQLGIEFKHRYLLDGAPRRAFRDGRSQRLEDMVEDVVVGMAVLAEAWRIDDVQRDNRAAQEIAKRREAEAAERRAYVQKRRWEVIDEVIREVTEIEHLRRLVASTKAQIGGTTIRVQSFLADLEQRLLLREEGLSPDALERRFEDQEVFGENDDKDFRPTSRWY